MAETSPSRIWTGAALGAAGTVAAILAGAPLVAALIALFAGVGAFWMVGRGANGGDAPVAAPPPTGGPPLPDARALIDALDEPTLLVRERRILVANPAARAVLGPHIEGVDVRLAIRHPAASERLAAPAPPGLGNGMGTGTAEDGPTELVGIGEPGRRWEMRTARLVDGHILVHLADRSAAYAAEQMRVDFVANASHELRTPLATVLGFIETLQDDETAADAGTRGRFLGIMADEASRMRTLLDDLMSLSRIEADRYVAPRDAVALAPLAEEVKASLARQAEKREARVEIVDRVPGATVAGDRPQLSQMLHNLVANALKYGRTGGEVAVRIEPANGEMLRLTVADNGEGIAADHLPRLTERFYRVDAGRSRAVGGTGLGLAIVKHIVSRHRGRMEIDSTPGAGTEVRIFLPRAAAATETLSSKSHGSVTEGTSSGPRDAANPA